MAPRVIGPLAWSALALAWFAAAHALVVPRALPQLSARPLATAQVTMRAPWRKFAAASNALAPRALQNGRDPATLGEAWTWIRAYRFPEDVCEYGGHAGAAAAALDPSAIAVLAYSLAQAVFVFRAVGRCRSAGADKNPTTASREAALARGFGFVLAWHCSHFLAHEFKRPWSWFGSHYFYVLGMWQLAKALNSKRASGRRLLAYIGGDALLTSWGGDYVGLVSGVAYGAHAIAGCDTGDESTDRSVRRLIRFLSVASASLFGLVEICFCHRLSTSKKGLGFGSAHLAVELFVVFATIAFSRATERVVRRIPS